MLSYQAQAQHLTKCYEAYFVMSMNAISTLLHLLVTRPATVRDQRREWRCSQATAKACTICRANPVCTPPQIFCKATPKKWEKYSSSSRCEFILGPPKMSLTQHSANGSGLDSNQVCEILKAVNSYKTNQFVRFSKLLRLWFNGWKIFETRNRSTSQVFWLTMMKKTPKAS
jgi:hypothetical protein